MTHSHERRKFVRIYRNFILSYCEKDKPQIKYDISQVNNISRGGINFIAVKTFEPGTVIGIELRTPFITDTVYLEGKVLESKEKIAHLIYEVRLQFLDLSPTAEDVLDRIEKYHLKHPD